MKTHSRSFLVAFLAVALVPAAVAGAADSGWRSGAGSSGRMRRGSELDRTFRLAMARMDERLMALLAPASLDCADEILTAGMETCIARPNPSRAERGALRD